MKGKMDIEDLFKEELGQEKVIPVAKSYTTMRIRHFLKKFGFVMIGGAAVIGIGIALMSDGKNQLTSEKEVIVTSERGVKPSAVEEEKLTIKGKDESGHSGRNEDESKSSREGQVIDEQEELGTKKSVVQNSAQSRKTKSHVIEKDATIVKRTTRNSIKQNVELRSDTDGRNERNHFAGQPINAENKDKKLENSNQINSFQKDLNEPQPEKLDDQTPVNKLAKTRQMDSTEVILKETLNNVDNEHKAIANKVPNNQDKGDLKKMDALASSVTDIEKNTSNRSLDSAIQVNVSEVDSSDIHKDSSDIAFSDTTSNSTKKWIRKFKITLGALYNNSFSPSAAFIYNSSRSFTFQSGIKYPFFKKRIQVIIGIDYTTERHHFLRENSFEGFYQKVNEIDIALGRLEVPISVDYKLPIKSNVTFRIGAGMKFSKIYWDEEIAFDVGGTEVLHPDEDDSFLVDRLEPLLNYKFLYGNISKNIKKTRVNFQVYYYFNKWHMDAISDTFVYEYFTVNSVRAGLSVDF